MEIIETEKARAGETSPNHAILKVLTVGISLAVVVMLALVWLY